MTDWKQSEVPLVPDIIGTVRQYKIFRIAPTMPLMSLGHTHLWTTKGWNYATCQDASPCLRDVPDPHHGCGFYTFHLADTFDRTQQAYCLGGREMFAMAAVEVTGGMVFHPLGLRSAMCRLLAVTAFGRPGKDMLDMYTSPESGCLYSSEVAVLGSVEELAALYPPEDVSSWLGKTAHVARSLWLNDQAPQPLMAGPAGVPRLAQGVMAPGTSPGVSWPSQVQAFRRLYGTITGRLGRKS